MQHQKVGIEIIHTSNIQGEEVVLMYLRTYVTHKTNQKKKPPKHFKHWPGFLSSDVLNPVWLKAPGPEIYSRIVTVTICVT